MEEEKKKKTEQEQIQEDDDDDDVLLLMLMLSLSLTTQIGPSWDVWGVSRAFSWLLHDFGPPRPIFKLKCEKSAFFDLVFKPEVPR